MKIKNIFLCLFPLIGLMSCGPTTPETSNQPTSTYDEETSRESVTSTSLAKNEIMVYFFDNAVNTDMTYPFFYCVSALGEKITKPEKDPKSLDPAYNIFKGWSSKLIAMEEEDYWDFENDVIPLDVKDKKAFRLYGQWDYVE